MHYIRFISNRRLVCKQADTVLGAFLLPRESPLILQRSYDYYEGVTTHDSSLSACVFSMMAARLGNLPLAMRYFEATVGIDIEDQSGNTRDGLHIANMGGAYLSIIAGFGGMRLNRDGLHLFPLFPENWQSYVFLLSYLGSRISVSVNAEGCALRLLEGPNRRWTVFLTGAYALQGPKPQIDRPVRGVICDLDGVITDTARFHYAAWKQIANELNIPFDEEFNERFKGVSRAQCLELLLEAGGQKRTPEEKTALTNRKNAFYVERHCQL
jgi:alpha,alpha-trehalose phosphorylase